MAEVPIDIESLIVIVRGKTKNLVFFPAKVGIEENLGMIEWSKFHMMMSVALKYGEHK